MGHHNLMQVVGGHTRGNTERIKRSYTTFLFSFCNGTSQSCTIVKHISTHIKEAATSAYDEMRSWMDECGQSSQVGTDSELSFRHRIKILILSSAFCLWMNF